jgi:Reverse transcriptase (RNA-dependent DNA polymerase)
VNYILDADIRSFFDSVSQEWLVRFVEHRIAGKRIVRLIQKWLRAGILEDGAVTVSDRGTGQGSVISPLLANIYLHYVFDLWAERWRRHEATGDMIVVRYADDLVLGFQHECDARRFLDALRARAEEFALQLHPDKTRLIEFGRHAAADALAGPRTGQLAGAGYPGLLRLSCCARQLRGAQQPQAPHRPAMATHAPAAEPEGQDALEQDGEAGQGLPPGTEDPSSMACRALRRRAPEVGAGCLNWASRSLNLLMRGVWRA